MLKSISFHRCQRRTTTVRKAKNTKVNLTKTPTEQVAPISRSENESPPGIPALPDGGFVSRASVASSTLAAMGTTTARRTANAMASRLFVKGRTPKTRHGHDYANAITSTGGGPKRRAATDAVVAAVAAVVVLSPRSPGARPFEERPAVRRSSVQRDPSGNATESSAMNNRGISRISSPERDFIAGSHNHADDFGKEFRVEESTAAFRNDDGSFPSKDAPSPRTDEGESGS